MSPLSSSNVDSQGIVYTLTISNKTAVIANQIFNTGRNSGLFSYYVGKTFMIRSQLFPDKYVDAHDVPRGASNICIWENTTDNLNRSWTIDEKGRLISHVDPGWCVYMNSLDTSGKGRLTMAQISTLSESDDKQYWGFDNLGHIYHAANPTYYWDLTDENADNGNTITLRVGDCAGKRRFWTIVPDSRYSEFSTLTFKRGVEDSNGIIYKLTGMASDALSNNANYTTLNFPQHKMSEFNYDASGLPSNMESMVFRDGHYNLYSTVNLPLVMTNTTINGYLYNKNNEITINGSYSSSSPSTITLSGGTIKLNWNATKLENTSVWSTVLSLDNTSASDLNIYITFNESCIFTGELTKTLFFKSTAGGNINLYMSSGKSGVTVTFDGGQYIQGVTNYIGNKANLYPQGNYTISWGYHNNNRQSLTVDDLNNRMHNNQDGANGGIHWGAVVITFQ